MGVMKCEDEDWKRKFGNRIYHIWGEADILEQAESKATELRSEGYLVRLVALSRSGAYRIWVFKLMSQQILEWWCGLRQNDRFEIINDAYRKAKTLNS